MNLLEGLKQLPTHLREAGLFWGVFLAGLGDKAQVHIRTFDFSVVGAMLNVLIVVC